MEASLSTLKQQTEAKVAAGRKGNPVFMKGIDDAIAKARAVKDGELALKVGDKYLTLNCQAPKTAWFPVTSC